jgi:F-type H+-transporting ATPase subunit delta
MRINKQSRREAKALFNACRVDGVLDDGRVRQAVAQVIAQKPRSYIATLYQFQRLVKLDVDRRTAVVESAVPLAPALQETVKASLTQLRGAGLSLSFAVNPALIGGMKARVGSDIYDGSVAGRLAALESSLAL